MAWRGVARLGGSSDDGRTSGTADFMTARVAGGIHNSDGSTGLNFGATATIVGGEATHPFGEASSLTGGASFGVGGEVSLGFKLEGPHGKPALCVRVAPNPTVQGVCLERPW